MGSIHPFKLNVNRGHAHMHACSHTRTHSSMCVCDCTKIVAGTLYIPSNELFTGGAQAYRHTRAHAHTVSVFVNVKRNNCKIYFYFVYRRLRVHACTHRESVCVLNVKKKYCPIYFLVLRYLERSQPCHQSQAYYLSDKETMLVKKESLSVQTERRPTHWIQMAWKHELNRLGNFTGRGVQKAILFRTNHQICTFANNRLENVRYAWGDSVVLVSQHT